MKGYFPEGWLSDTVTNKKKIFTPLSITQAMQSGDILEAAVLMCDADHNLIVNLGCMNGIIPRVDGAVGIKEGTVRDIALISRVGKSVCFTVKSVETDSGGKMYAILSRREAQIQCSDNYISKLTPGDVIDARVTHLETFGAFCDIGCGIIAMLPIDSISVSRIAHPRDRFRIGDDIKVVVKQIMPDGRVMLSHKELLGTWEENADLIKAGQTVTGIIRSVESYGVFVEITPNLAGLAEPKADVSVGQQASVFIKSIIPEKMKVKLIIIDSFDSYYVTPIKYFTDEEHLDEWYYSPPDSVKQIYTEF
ncbi:MAG: S1 RNA-binding domain-containing protein [Clostridia bacterium]|nr:S1 RNA-binding domain-containing protein [Clostridia bacterium]MBQ3562174.1 S1 RNA-binding domain-containing protein [Clostridia bacterium]